MLARGTNMGITTNSRIQRKKEQEIWVRTFEESLFNRPTKEVTRLVKLNGKDHGREVHFMSYLSYHIKKWLVFLDTRLWCVQSTPVPPKAHLNMLTRPRRLQL